MADTGRKINYGLRFAKHVERKMLCDALIELATFERIKDYRYVGFGSFYFSDFTLFHKRLGITDMLSIESETSLKPRCEANKPYKVVKLKMGKSEDVLREADFDWSRKTVLWLDYDKRLQDAHLEDIAFVCSKLSSGSVLLVTVNADPGFERPPNTGAKGRVETLKESLSPRYIREGLKDGDLSQWKTAEYYREIIDDVIKASLAENFSYLPLNEQTVYEQIFNFHYEDGAKMLTVGGVLFKEADRTIVSRCNFDDMEFIRRNEGAFLIKIPMLTYRELRYLDTHLPDLTGEAFPLGEEARRGIPEEDINSYSTIYRYFPTFADADI